MDEVKELLTVYTPEDEEDAMTQCCPCRDWYGSITLEDGVYIAHGQLGEGNEYKDLMDVMSNCLSGHNINIDNDIYFNL